MPWRLRYLIFWTLAMPAAIITMTFAVALYACLMPILGIFKVMWKMEEWAFGEGGGAMNGLPMFNLDS